MSDLWDVSSLRERLIRGVAVGFLLFTFADVAFPPPCAGCNEGRSVTRHALAQAVGADVSDHSKAFSTNDSESNQPHERGCCDEDCCFGCAHVLSSVAVRAVPVFDMRSMFVDTVQQFMPEPPLRTTYRPPRFI